MTSIQQLESVLCDPTGKCCIHGSEADRQIVDSALAALRTELSALAAAQAEPAHPLQNAKDTERMAILKAIGNAGLILIKTHLGFELVKKSMVLACKQGQA